MLNQFSFVLCLCFLYGVLCNTDDTFQFLNLEAQPCAEKCKLGSPAYEVANISLNIYRLQEYPKVQKKTKKKNSC